MEEEKKEQPTPSAQNDYLEELLKLKANSVPKDEYDKLRAEQKRLIETMFNGTSEPEQPDSEEEKPSNTDEDVDIQALRNELYGGSYEGSDLDYATKVLKLRRAIMKSGKPDPAVSSGQKTNPEEYDYENCESICQQLEDCIAYANGDDTVFRAELMRRMKK